MFHVVLFQPEIPPNTGNIIRLCANTGATLHLIHPLGFSLADSRLRRAGLDYRERSCVREYQNLQDFVDIVCPKRMLGCSTRGTTAYSNVIFEPNDALLFGPETRGLPEQILSSLPHGQRLRIPMRPANRSLNLSNAVAVVLYEAWRQHGFAGAQV